MPTRVSPPTCTFSAPQLGAHEWLMKRESFPMRPASITFSRLISIM